MSNGQRETVLQHLRRLVAAECGGTGADRQLLERFVCDHDETAFAALVKRHGPMVLGVCRRVLRHEQDAEDACQAAFLVLARKASSVRKHDSLGSWLHGVAFRAASNLRRSAARRHAHERPATDEPRARDTEVTWREVRTVLDEELRRLPERFQAPLLLCYLEGRTRDEAAQELGWSLGTLRGRLERGRDLLRQRLTRRGVTLPAALLGSLLAEQAAAAALPATQVVALVRAAAAVAAGQAPAVGLISTQVAAVAAGVMRAMFMIKLKIVGGAVLALGLAGFGVGLLANGALAWQRPSDAVSAPAPGPVVGDKLRDPDEPPAGGGRAVPPIDSRQLALRMAQSRLNLKHIALALHNYHDVHGHFPSPAIYEGQKQDQGVAGPGGMRGMMGAAGPSGMGAPGGGDMMPGGTPMGPAGIGMPSGTPLRAKGLADRGPGAQPPGGGGPAEMMIRVGGGEGAGGDGIAAVTGKNSKALLSWRVAILPYLGEVALYRQFRLNEPWDSATNKKLLAKMPKVFAPPGGAAREPFATYYQAFVGSHAVFDKHRWTRITDIPDGTSNTILVAEAGAPVPWTKPEDLHFAADDPLPELGGLFPGVFHVALADGSVVPLSKKGDADTLRKLIMRDDGWPVDVSKVRAPATRREAELREQNERLRQELDREQSRLEELRTEKDVLQESIEDPASKQLKQENEQLEQQLRKLRDEAEQMRHEIQRLKQASEKRPDRK